ncbi:complement decay-accelerating factor, GPI-anchored-like [Sinocyclocheilus rhinocerous]|uniref:Complement decay-accelerating factor, GPI-anchored-like n=1 Tax=Sinocyclocheilus rhinocerous TaxID=307959 RepID=A0A673J324_9TELE|nr:PREDICTED: complement decay-accelerating factor, GPI-anchored-like [Sinocyclocheilus rhinocerous]XP_016395947.1 PREDICTED: complement decay-accelerating factor, GPI-anchored-like [Sinocyclocheilus rhinocerous]
MTSVKAWPLLLLPFSLVSMGKAECPFPVLNGKIVLSSESILKNSFPDNSEAFVECAKGFERDEGPTSITCVNGVWSPVKLTCKKMDCRQPELSPHMTYFIPDGTFFGAYIQPICETGYDLEGSSHRQCLVSGWSGSAECILTVCEYPDPIEHGKRVAPSEPVFNDVITYSCDDNYILVGNSSITCGEYGVYSSPPPECIVIITPTKASTTTNKATTDMTTASTRSHRGLVKKLTIGLSALLSIAIALFCFFGCRNLKRKGSYNTGEELRAKEELLLNQSV